MSTSENDDGDDDCYYEMEPLPQIQNSKLLTTTEILDTCEPSTPDDLDENFYQIDDSPPLENTCHHYIDEPFTPSIETVAIPNFHYSVLSQDEYIELMMNYVQEVKDILKLSSPIVKLLLHYFKWNKQKLMENFYDNENHDDLFLQAKIVNPFSIPPSEIEQNEIICSICCSDEQKDMYSLDCKHVFCKDCWKHYLINQIVNEGLGQTISCPETNCDVLVDDETVSKFIADNDFVKHLYKRIIINSYVANNPRARWCPGKNCGCIINATSLTSAYNYAQFIICSNCDMSFCFQCAHPWHDPIKCVFVLKWNKKLVDDSETIIWMKANTKCCPKCRVTIEKNGGCNHMSCKHCNYEFCWLCSGMWSKHNECNRFNPNAVSEEMQAIYAASLSRYLHYNDRYHNHEHSLELETKQYERTKQQVEKNERQISTNDFRIIKDAFEVLLKCRQVLMYTYPFAFYLDRNNQAFVFEQNQADLERSCEELSELLEQDLSKETIFKEIKLKIFEKYRYCDKRKNVLLTHVKEGYLNNYWKYLEDI